MDNFLGNDNIGGYVSTLNKSILGRVNDVWKMIFDYLSKRFSNSFISNITETYRSEIFWCVGGSSLWNENNMSFIYGWGKETCLIESVDQIVNVLTDP